MTNLQEKCIQSRLVECGIYFCLVAEGSRDFQYLEANKIK